MSELYILLNLKKAFDASVYYQQYVLDTDARLSLCTIRIPNISLYPIKKTPRKYLENIETLVPYFLIAIFSQMSIFTQIESKIKEYFEACEAIWLTEPQLEKVDIYTSTTKVEISAQNNDCAANPAPF